jgi:hypothetical protein
MANLLSLITIVLVYHKGVELARFFKAKFLQYCVKILGNPSGLPAFLSCLAENFALEKLCDLFA